MATSDEIKRKALELSEKTDSNSISPKEVGGIMHDLASLGENAIRNGGTLGIRKVYTSVSVMEADKNPKDFWGNPMKKGNLVLIYDGTTTGLDNNKIYVYMNPGWEFATYLDAGYPTRQEFSELGSEVFLEELKRAAIDTLLVGNATVPSIQGYTIGNLDGKIQKSSIPGMSVCVMRVYPNMTITFNNVIDGVVHFYDSKFQWLNGVYAFSEVTIVENCHYIAFARNNSSRPAIETLYNLPSLYKFTNENIERIYSEITNKEELLYDVLSKGSRNLYKSSELSPIIGDKVLANVNYSSIKVSDERFEDAAHFSIIDNSNKTAYVQLRQNIEVKADVQYYTGLYVRINASESTSARLYIYNRFTGAGDENLIDVGQIETNKWVKLTRKPSILNTSSELVFVTGFYTNSLPSDVTSIDVSGIFVYDYQLEQYVSDRVSNETKKYIQNLVESGAINTWAKGLSLYSLGDSLGTSGKWQSRIAELIGAEFDKETNYNGNNNTALSVGGSRTAGMKNCGFDRLYRLESLQAQGNQIDILLIENINDMSTVNLNTDIDNINSLIQEAEPYIETQWLDINTGQNSYNSAFEWFKNNISSALANVTPKQGTVVNLLYASTENTYNVKIGSSASKDGQIVLNVGGKQYAISVTSGMTASNIVDKILEVDYTNPTYTDKKGSDGVSVDFVADNGSPLVSCDSGDTGVSVTVTKKSGSTKNVTICYKGTNSDNFIDSSQWTEWWGFVSIVSSMKGLFEYIGQKFPRTRVFWFIPSRFALNFDTTQFKREDGSLNIDAYYRSDDFKRYDILTKIQNAVASYYNIPTIDMHKYSGINIHNAHPNYYRNMDVHPTDDCYKIWGDMSVKYIT